MRWNKTTRRRGRTFSRRPLLCFIYFYFFFVRFFIYLFFYIFILKLCEIGADAWLTDGRSPEWAKFKEAVVERIQKPVTSILSSILVLCKVKKIIKNTPKTIPIPYTIKSPSKSIIIKNQPIKFDQFFSQPKIQFITLINLQWDNVAFKKQ